MTSTSITSVADLDLHLNLDNGAFPPLIPKILNPFERRFIQASSVYVNLLHIKTLFREHPIIDNRFKERRETHLRRISTETTSNSPSLQHMRSYAKVFSEINRENGDMFGRGHVKRFLDLGCSPGGFSSWLVRHNYNARGLGITLPDEDAKFPMIFPDSDPNKSRYQVVHKDIISLAIDSISAAQNPLAPVREEEDNKPYDLVIGGAFPTLEGQIPWWLRVQLVLAQILILFGNIRRGGDFILVINTKPFLWVVEVIGLLRRSFHKLEAMKGGRLHAVRTSCYIVCTGFRASDGEAKTYQQRLRESLTHLEALLLAARTDDANGPQVLQTKCGRSGIALMPHGNPEEDIMSLLGASMDEVFDTEHQFVLALFEPLWRAQYDAIYTDFTNELKDKVSLDGSESRKEPVPINIPTTDPALMTPPPSPTAWRSPRSPTAWSSFIPSRSGAAPSWRTTMNTLNTEPPVDDQIFKPLPSPSANATVPKWRAQRRMTVSVEGGTTNSGSQMDKALPMGRREDDGEIARHRSSSTAAANSSNWWRSK